MSTKPLRETFDKSGKYNLDLERAVREKTKYNSQREYRHGGKKA